MKKKNRFRIIVLSCLLLASLYSYTFMNVVSFTPNVEQISEEENKEYQTPKADISTLEFFRKIMKTGLKFLPAT